MRGLPLASSAHASAATATASCIFVCIILLRVAAAVYLLTDLLVAAAPVVMLASGITAPGLTSTSNPRRVGQGGAGAQVEDHFVLRRVRGPVRWRFCVEAKTNRVRPAADLP